jgi:HEAT repeat protein
MKEIEATSPTNKQLMSQDRDGHKTNKVWGRFLRRYSYVGSLSLIILIAGCSSKKSDEANSVKQKKDALGDPVLSDQTESPEVVSGEKPKIQSSKVDNYSLPRVIKTNRHRKRFVSDLDENQQQSILDVRSVLTSEGNDEEKIEALEKLSEVTHQAVVGLVITALKDPSEEVRVVAMELLVDYESPKIIPAVRTGLSDPSEAVRIVAVDALLFVDSPEVVDLFTQALTDESDIVRDTALAIVEEKPADISLPVLSNVIDIADESLILGVASILQDMSSHAAMDVLIQGLKSNNPFVNEEVSSTIDFLISQQFSDYSEAKAWWDANKNQFDSELFPKGF